MPNQKNSQLFHSGKFCSVCGKTLSPDYKDTLCSACLEQKLFADVREYIRTHNVTEREVAEHFGIPMVQMKQWIRDGRIEYKLTGTASGRGLYELTCMRCGKPISVGSYCASCMKLVKNKSGSLIQDKDYGGHNKFHYQKRKDT